MFVPELMTTSEFIIGHSADDAAERRGGPRKILWALLVAVLIHFLVAYSIAVSGGLFASHPMEEDKPMELTFVDLAAPRPVAAKTNPMFMDTPDSKKVPEPPAEPTFESNANAKAASEQPATGDAPLPSQEGRERPSIDLDTHQASIANQGAQAQPSVAPQETPQPSVAATPQPTAPPDQFAMLRATPTPTPETRPSSTPQQQASSYQPYKERTRQSGRITNRGIASVNAVGTPLGRYKKFLYDSVGSRWYHYIGERGDMAGIGTAHVVFSIDRSGQVKNLKIIENTSNETFANICLQSIMEVQLPPIPEELAASLPPEGLVDEISFTMFAN
jgi:outer membrane biosynthesis protein TonB